MTFLPLAQRPLPPPLSSLFSSNPSSRATFVCVSRLWMIWALEFVRDLEEILSKSSKSRLSVCGVTWKQVYECRCVSYQYGLQHIVINRCALAWSGCQNAWLIRLAAHGAKRLHRASFVAFWDCIWGVGSSYWVCTRDRVVILLRIRVVSSLHCSCSACRCGACFSRCSVAFAPIDLFLLQGGKVSEDWQWSAFQF